MTAEEWRLVSEFPGYEVSNLGRVRSWHKRGYSTEWRDEPLLLSLSGGTKYAMVTLVRNGIHFGIPVQRMVAHAFLGHRPEGLQICHNNGDPRDNRVSNLRYDTAASNQADRILHGTTSRGEANPRAKLTRDDVIKVRLLAKQGIGGAAIARMISSTPSNIWRILHGPNWSWLRCPDCGGCNECAGVTA